MEKLTKVAVRLRTVFGDAFWFALLCWPAWHVLNNMLVDEPTNKRWAMATLGSCAIAVLIRRIFDKIRTGSWAHRVPTGGDAQTQLRQRASDMRRNANYALALILISIAGGMVIFVNAGTIADREPFMKHSETLRDYSIDLVKYTSIAETIELRFRELRRPDSRNADTASIAETLAVTNEHINEMTDAHRSLKASLVDLNVAAANAEKKASFIFMISTISTRIVTALLLVFLVQILLKTHRYSIRLATFYDGRADALLVAKERSVDMEKSVSLFDAMGVDIGPEPTPASLEAINIAKEAIAALGKKA